MTAAAGITACAPGWEANLLCTVHQMFRIIQAGLLAASWLPPTPENATHTHHRQTTDASKSHTFLHPSLHIHTHTHAPPPPQHTPTLHKAQPQRPGHNKEQTAKWRAASLRSPGDLFLHSLCVRLSEEVEQAAAEVVRVAVGIPQLVGDGCQEQVTTCVTQGYRRVDNWPSQKCKSH